MWHCFISLHFKFYFICSHPSAHRMHLSPMENFIVSRLLTPTQSSLARSRSTLMLSEQYDNPGKKMWITHFEIVMVWFWLHLSSHWKECSTMNRMTIYMIVQNQRWTKLFMIVYFKTWKNASSYLSCSQCLFKKNIVKINKITKT